MEIVIKYRRLLALAVALLLIISSCIAIFFVAGDSDLKENERAAWLAIPALFINLASTVIAFFIASLLFRREDTTEQKSLLAQALADALAANKEDPAEQQKILRKIVDEAIGRPNLLGQIQWADLIENASEIDFIVQGWDGWALQQPTAQALAHFFSRGGQFRLYVCHPDSDEGARARYLMERRLGKSPGEVESEIRNTARNIDEAREETTVGQAAASKLEVFQTNNLNWYFAALFKGRELIGQARSRDVLLFSIYSHTPRKPRHMPVMVIHPDVHSDINMMAWFNSELQHLREGATPSASAMRTPKVGSEAEPT